MATVLVLDVKSDKIRPAECDDLIDFYRELNADLFDIAKRKIGGKYYDIFCDDIGLWRDNPVVSAIDSNMKPMLVGNLVFANHDSTGETTSLTEEDVERIVHNLYLVKSAGDDKEHMVIMCDY